MTVHIDLITVYHNDTNYQQHLELRNALARHEPAGGYRFIGVDNRTRNRGFAVACNLGARHPDANAPIIGFLNPDVEVDGPFIAEVRTKLTGRCVITGCRFEKSDHDLNAWGVNDWVCGAALFVNRKWFQVVDGFDEQFVWSHEETDLIRQAESQRLTCEPIDLPIRHESPGNDSQVDVAYKRYHFEQAQKRFLRKWGSQH